MAFCTQAENAGQSHSEVWNWQSSEAPSGFGLAQHPCPASAGLRVTLKPSLSAREHYVTCGARLAGGGTLERGGSGVSGGRPQGDGGPLAVVGLRVPIRRARRQVRQRRGNSHEVAACNPQWHSVHSEKRHERGWWATSSLIRFGSLTVGWV